MAVRLWGLLTSLEQRCSAAAAAPSLSLSTSRVSFTSITTTSTTTTTTAGDTSSYFHHHHRLLRSFSHFYSNRRSCSGEAAAFSPLGGGAGGGGAGGEDEAQARESEEEAEDEDVATRKRLEQALIELRIHNAAPDWLPLFPGGSYWIHPDQIGMTSRRHETPSGPLLDPVTEREIFAMVTPMGWPVESAADDAMDPKSGFTR